MRIVADTNVIVSGLFWKGPSHQILNLARREILELATTAELPADPADVLSRDVFAHRLLKIGATVDEAVHGYAAIAKLVQPITIAPTVRRDPDDDAVLACAVAAAANMIVSGDSDLLQIAEFEGIRIVPPASALTIIGEHQQ